MSHPFTLFEVSWEACNKLGGVYSVLATKARTARERLGTEPITVGPWLLHAEGAGEPPLREEPGYEAFVESCRALGLPVRVGRWRVPGEPLAFLVEFSHLYGSKDAILAGLWEDFQVDSLSGAWDYVEPLLFGYAAGRVIELYHDQVLAPQGRRTLVHAHDWLAAACVLYLKRVPGVGTVFTTHGSALGRRLAARGILPVEGAGRPSAELARELELVAQHSLEGAAVRQCDVYTTVSELTADEAELLHGRRPRPLLPNGIDLEVIDGLAGPLERAEARRRVEQAAARFLGEPVDDRLFVCLAGRYEFHAKGIDLLLEAAAELNRRPGRRVLVALLVPAGNSGLKAEFIERLEQPDAPVHGALGLATHNLFDEASDPIAAACRSLGLDNAPEARMQVIHLPIYLSATDRLLGLSYEATLRTADLTCFPSFYEPWGTTPQESLALGVPTITTDHAGFGLWASAHGLGPADGVHVLRRRGLPRARAISDLATLLEEFARDPARRPSPEVCRAAAARGSWDLLYGNYLAAYSDALEAVAWREEHLPRQRVRPPVPLPVRPVAEHARPRLVRFEVSATLPRALAGLERLARNLWWCWDAEAVNLFTELSPVAWARSGHEPLRFLQGLAPEDLAARAEDPAYVARLRRTLERFEAYLAESPRTFELESAGPSAAPVVLSEDAPVAYFCAEYGLHESLPIYSGGLGVLAGDHLKSASDLRLPLVAVGLFYAQGYLAQRIALDGEQHGAELRNDPRVLPMEAVRGPDGAPLEVRLALPGRELCLRAWKVSVGRVPLYLLDTDVPANRPEDRAITEALYRGGPERRILQEIVLGRGGMRVLRALGIEPAVYHLNEGHAAFLALERVSHLVRREGLQFEEARELVRATTAFTTHTPVPAGHDRFPEDLVRRHFSDAEEWVGLPWERFFALGQAPADGQAFNMTYLALRFAGYVNGVSRLHGAVSRKLLHPMWPGLCEGEVPVSSVTNGIHLATWTDPELARELGAHDRPVRPADFAQRAGALEDGRLWDLRMQGRARLLAHMRTRTERSFLARHDSPRLLQRTLDGLDPGALWIGFARRFAPYKRAHLLFQDPARLRAILADSERPVRLVVAGKAHPEDQHGKDIVRMVVGQTRSEDFVGKVFFLEDYDMDLARDLVQGVDVWLNNPIRMLEASGTSGMKAAANGALNLSIADGWWPEAADGLNGWTIGDGRVYEDQGLQDQLDAAVLYRLLEEEIVPMFYQRDARGLPLEWLARVKHDLATVPTVFNMDRQVEEYLAQAYLPLARRGHGLGEGRRQRLREETRERSRLRRAFEALRIVSAEIADLSDLRVGDEIGAKVVVDLGELSPEDVWVELVLSRGGSADPTELLHVALAPSPADGAPGGPRAFVGAHAMERPGSYSYGIRVRPRAALRAGDSLADLVLWA